MKFKINLPVVLFILFSAGCVFAETSIKAEVDKISIATDDTLTYKLIITTSEKDIPVPLMPKFEGFDVVSQAQSSTITFAKGGSNTNLVYVFILAPRLAGKLTIQPVTLKVGLRKYESQQFQIGVTQGKPKPKISPNQELTLPQTTL